MFEPLTIALPEIPDPAEVQVVVRLVLGDLSAEVRPDPLEGEGTWRVRFCDEGGTMSPSAAAAIVGPFSEVFSDWHEARAFAIWAVRTMWASARVVAEARRVTLQALVRGAR